MRARLSLLAVPAAAFVLCPPPAGADPLCVAVTVTVDGAARQVAPDCAPAPGPTVCHVEITDVTSRVEVRVAYCVPT